MKKYMIFFVTGIGISQKIIPINLADSLHSTNPKNFITLPQKGTYKSMGFYSNVTSVYKPIGLISGGLQHSSSRYEFEGGVIDLDSLGLIPYRCRKG